MAASSETQAAHESLESGSRARLATMREQGPLGGRVQAPAAQGAGEDLVQAEPAATGRRAPRRRPNGRDSRKRSSAGAARDERLARRQGPRQRADQAPDGVGVELVLAAEVVQDPDLRATGRLVPLVVGEGQIADLGAVAVAPPGRPQVHAGSVSEPIYQLQYHTRADVYLAISTRRTRSGACFVLSEAVPRAFRAD